MKEQPKKSSVYHRLLEGPEAVLEVDGEILLKILVGLPLAFHLSRDHQTFCSEGRIAARLTAANRMQIAKKIQLFIISIGMN